MNSQEYPEVKLAHRVIEKYCLTPPIDVRFLLERYAKVVFESIPIQGVDGIALNIKVPGKTPEIIINKDSIETRQNFTMAHELGHLLIPWHTGIKVDKESVESMMSYSGIEAEANRFAAALLMPTDYILKIESQTQNLAEAHYLLWLKAGVSPVPAAIRMSQVLPAGIIYCIERSGTVEFAGKTRNTSGESPPVGSALQEDYPPFQAEYSKRYSGSLSVHWWRRVTKKISKPVKQLIADNSDDRSWREILDKIVQETKHNGDADAYKRKINGAVANLNGSLVLNGDYSEDSLINRCMERLSVPPYDELSKHKDFEVFVIKKVADLISRRRL